MHRLLFIIAFVLTMHGVTRAQNFDYSTSADSVAWNELSSQTILNAGNTAWNFSYKIPIGFTFPFCGRNFDSLTIETNGYLVFDIDKNYAVTAFSGLADWTDAEGTHAVLGYELSGTTGNHILKIQYKNIGEMGIPKSLSHQIWLKENGTVEFRVGPSTLRYDDNNEVDTLQRYRMGLLNLNMDTEERGIMIGGNPYSPFTQAINDATPDVPFLAFIPAHGFRYTFTPNF